MKFAGKKTKRTRKKNKPEWRPWFAWRPVRLGDWLSNDGDWIWLEWVERKRTYHFLFVYFSYRELPPEPPLR